MNNVLPTRNKKNKTNFAKKNNDENKGNINASSAGTT